MNETRQHTPQAGSFAIRERVREYASAFSGNGSDLRSFIEKVPAAQRLAALRELTIADLELRWNSGQRFFVEDYMNLLPELKQHEQILLELYRTEFAARRATGETPRFEEYRQRFPKFEMSTRELSPAFGTTTPLASHAAEDTTRDNAPERVGRYRVERCLGSGAFGDVYCCFDPELRRRVAVKLARGGHGKSSRGSAEFLHEARAAARLDHPNIVRVLDVGESEEGRAFIVYEFVEGETMASRILSGAYTPAEAVGWIASIAAALHEAHLHGLVHRDIKPGNILIDGAGRARLTDFGLAKLDDRFYTVDRGTIGTYAYMSPEQAEGKSHWATPQSDIYSLGTVLYELVSRRRPFAAETKSELREQIARRPVVAPRAIDDGIPRDLEAVCLKALAKDPAQRYLTASDMAADLRAALAEKPKRRHFIAVLALLSTAAVVLMIARFGLYTSAPVGQPTFDITREPTLLVRAKRSGQDVSDVRPGGKPLTAGDVVSLYVTSRYPAYFYVYWYDAEGKTRLVWPKSFARQERKYELEIPQRGGGFAVQGQPGIDLAIALLSDQPLEGDDLRAFQREALPELASLVDEQSAVHELSRPNDDVSSTSSSSETEEETTRGIGSEVIDMTSSYRVRFPASIRKRLSPRIRSLHGWFIPHL